MVDYLFSGILTSVSLFIATNVDDLIVLIMFFALYHQSKKRKEIIIGQFIGMTTLIGISLVLSYTIGKLDLFELRWLGVIPILLGVKTFFEKESDDEEELTKKENSLVAQVVVLTLLNGTDNIAVYTSLFTSLDINQLVLCLVTFLLMTGLWCYLAINLVRHEKIREKLIQYKRILVPVVLIYVGVNMLFG